MNRWSLWSRTISMPPRNRNKKSEFTWKKKNISFNKVCWVARRSLYTAGTLEIHAFLCTSWWSSQSQSVGTLHRYEAGFYQLPREWSLNKGTRSFPPSWKAPDLDSKTRATGPVLFIFFFFYFDWHPSSSFFTKQYPISAISIRL